MEIRTCPLDPGLTVAEIDPGTERSWHFLPFEDRRAELVALDDRYVVALGGDGGRTSSIAIFDTVERRRTAIETSDRLRLHAPSYMDRPWCYAPAHRSVFVPEATRGGVGFANPHQYLRQLAVDGSVNRLILIAPDFHVGNVVARDDGRLVCVGSRAVAVLDPATGQSQMSEIELTGTGANREYTSLRWFSPDGRWALRPHVGTVVRSGTPAARGSRALLARLLPARRADPAGGEEHPDLPGDGVRRFGIALDLFRLDPIGFERLLIVRYYSEEELFGADPSPWRAQAVAALDALADCADHRSWNGRDQLLLTAWEDDDESRAVKGLLSRIQNVRWDDDASGFTVSLLAGTREVQAPNYAPGFKVRVTDLALRHVSIDGAVGPLDLVPGEPKGDRPLPSREAIEAVSALVRERSSHRIECAGWSGAEVAAALAEIRRRIEEDGLERLVFGEQLQFRFRVGGKTIGEKKFFETVREMPAAELAPVLPELRQLVRSYGSAARKMQAEGHWTIASGPSDHSPAAMSEAALTLAMLDGDGFDALRGWVATVDQEHDDFAAAKVFPAVARRTGFATAETVRFGLWFFLQQWQSVKYERSWLGLFKAAPEVMPPAAFAAAVLEEARNLDGLTTETTVESGLGRVKEMLGRTFWDRAASAELDRLLAGLGAGDAASDPHE